MKKCLVVVLSLAASAAYAQSEGGLSNISFDQNRIENAAHGGHRWTLIGADTVGDGENVIGAQAGWPDLTLGITHGMSPASDVSGKFQLNYSFEGTTIQNKIAIGLLVPFRFNVVHNEKVSLLLHVDPGLKILTGPGPAKLGTQSGVGALIGFRPMPQLQIGFGIDVPAVVYFTGDQKPIIALPFLFGPFLEYHVDSNITIGVDTRFGVLWYSVGDFKDDAGDVLAVGFTDTQFAFRVQFAVGYRL
jgi:hypothetical protein